LRMRFGSPRDFLIGIRIALPDGKLASGGGRVVKNVSGYDMMKLHYGALGSLGVIVAASFKVFPKPLHDVTVGSTGGWDAALEGLKTEVLPSALEIDSEGRVIARYTGSPDAIKRVVAQLGWRDVDPKVWAEHSRSNPERWARISVPKERLREMTEGLREWWASPGVGVAYWAIDVDVRSVKAVRTKAEAAGGTLTMLAAPDDFMREVGAWGTAPSTLPVMKQLKVAFDPDGVLNPGRFVV
jgi:glycolate oxidase FAD binding subunit